MEELAQREFTGNGKLILQGRNLSAGLNFLKEVGWLSYFPELEALVDCPQDPEWYPGRCLGPYPPLPRCLCS